MCFKIVFLLYWVVGISAMIGLYNLIMAGVAKRHPGREGENKRRVASLPVGAAVYLLGMLLWGAGAQQVTSSVCPPDPSKDFIRVSHPS